MPEPRTQTARADHVVADQSEVAAFLAAPETHGGAPVERIDTHAAMVFLAGERAFKVKRAVFFPYMDFSTLELRRTACEREVALNRRTAPELYLDVVPVVRRTDGGLSLGRDEEDGEAVEWVVVMRRFEQDGLFDRLAQAGRLTAALLRGLADAIARFHDEAEVVDETTGHRGGARGMRLTLAENGEEFAERTDLFPPDRAARLDALTRARIERLSTLLDDRRDRGLVRRCHGDLHLRNICLIDGRPTLFDAIEFNDAISCIDVLYDLAFLLMDLDHRGLRAEANLVLNRYLQRRGELAGLAALPLFFSIRAAIRAKVGASAAASQRDEAARRATCAEARAYFDAALVYLTPPAAELVAVGGLSGSGKSTLGRRLAPHVGAAPGAVHLRSDVTRKALFGVDELARLPPEAYRPEVSTRVYGELLRRARIALEAGHSVVLDAVYGKEDGRAEVESLVRGLGLRFTGLWLEAAPRTLIERTAARRGDASDATPEVVRQQLEEAVGRLAWHRLDAGQPPEAVEAEARRLVASASSTTEVDG